MHPFIYNNNIKQADVIVVPKSNLNIVAHYAVYLGYNVLNQEIVSENNNVQGVRVITVEQFFQENPTYKRIRHFLGNEFQRSQAVQRAISLIGKPYDLNSFNCEHYANYVQYNQLTSRQADTVRGFAALAAALGIVVLVGAALNE